MRLRTLALAGVAAMAGFAAGRETQPTAAATAHATPWTPSAVRGTDMTDLAGRLARRGTDKTAVLATRAVEPADVDPDALAPILGEGRETSGEARDDIGDGPGADNGDEAGTDNGAQAGDDNGDDGGTDIGDLIAAAEQHVETQRHLRNVIVGRVEDQRSGEPIIGATVVASSPALSGAQAAVTDEHGNYEIAALPAGNYQLTFYYNESTDVRDGVTVSSFDVTRVIEPFDPTRDSAVSFTGTEDMENSYIIDDE